MASRMHALRVWFRPGLWAVRVRFRGLRPDVWADEPRDREIYRASVEEVDGSRVRCSARSLRRSHIARGRHQSRLIDQGRRPRVIDEDDWKTCGHIHFGLILTDARATARADGTARRDTVWIVIASREEHRQCRQIRSRPSLTAM